MDHHDSPVTYSKANQWQDAVYRNTLQQNYSLTVSGGSEKARGLMGLRYYYKKKFTSRDYFWPIPYNETTMRKLFSHQRMFISGVPSVGDSIEKQTLIRKLYRLELKK